MGSRYKFEKKEKYKKNKQFLQISSSYVIIYLWSYVFSSNSSRVVTIFFCGYYIIGFFGNIAEGDDELDEEIDLRAKRQREALVCVRPEDESEFQNIKQHQKYTVSTTQKLLKKTL